jgi:putative spermidine/putrescine transport system ATP-binding protein/spermidine/putrescine transport system ATP-binding protein
LAATRRKTNPAAVLSEGHGARLLTGGGDCERVTKIIELQGLAKTFKGNVRAVDDVSVAVDEGEFVTLLGPSGCGKSTMLRMIGGFEPPDQGRVLLDGDDVTDLPPYRRPVNMVFQEFALFPHMNVAENVGYGLRVAGVKNREAGDQVGDLLHMVGLLDQANKSPSELSNAQRQRVALARALIRRPRALLLDEPLAALDPKLREVMQVELRHLHDQIGVTFVMATADPTEALVMSDRILVMSAGRIVQDGSQTEIYETPATPYVANIIGTSNMITGRVAVTGADALIVHFENGEIRCTANGRRYEVGDLVTLSVRPEKTLVVEDGASAPPGHSVIEGRVIDCLFHGSFYRIELDIDEGAPFIVEVQLQVGAEHASVPALGSNLTVALNPESVTAFATETML